MYIEDENSERTILVVEDSRAIARELCNRIENDLGFRCIIAYDYAQAKKFIESKEHDFFVAILDLLLPDAEDDEILELAKTYDIPAVVFTSDFDSERRRAILSRDIIDYIVKDSMAIPNIIKLMDRLHKNTEITVLVVDDSTSFRSFMNMKLKNHMFNTLLAGDGKEALQILKANEQVSMVITDYEMPKMDGVELTKAIRREYSVDKLPIIGVSIARDHALSARFIKNGANDFLSKPFEDEEFFCRVHHNIENMEHIRELANLNQLKNRFLGMVAHDLRSPISGIKGLSSIMLDEASESLDSEHREIFELIHSSSTHMNDLVNDLLDITVIEAGELKLLKAKTNFDDLVANRVHIHHFAARQKNIDLTFSGDLPDDFLFDKRRISQVIDNLLTNAIKFSPAGGEVIASTVKSGHMATLHVRDNGRGIPPGEEELLFKTFKKTSVQPTGGEKSTGLGLSIVKRIVDEHGGYIDVQSEYGKGAIFSIHIPLLGVD